MTDAPITPEILLNAYASGLFPMAEDAGDDEFYWYQPEKRGQLSIQNLKIPKRLRRSVLQFPFKVTVNRAFKDVIEACAEQTPDRPSTWINSPIKNLFIDLHGHGFTHSVECWSKDGDLVGGLYGLSIGGLFAGESMFSRERDASKIALVHLCARLSKSGHKILDTQFVNDHLKQFGVYEISHEEYLQKLQKALPLQCDFTLSGTFTDPFDMIKKYLDKNTIS